MAIVTLVVMEPGSRWPGRMEVSENLVVRRDGHRLLQSTRRRLDSLHRQGHRARVAVLACNDATDLGSIERRAEVAHELLGAVASTPSGLLVLSSADHVSVDLRRELLSLAGALSCRIQGTLATVVVRFDAAIDGPEAIHDAVHRARAFPSRSNGKLSPPRPERLALAGDAS